MTIEQEFGQYAAGGGADLGEFARQSGASDEDMAILQRHLDRQGLPGAPSIDLLRDPRGVPPDYFTGIHEMGHVLDLMGQTDRAGASTRARQRLEKELLQLYLREHPDQRNRVMKPGVPGHSSDEWGLGSGMKDFGRWLRTQMPGGAFQGNSAVGQTGGMNLGEGIAHAFTEGELNPQANDVAKLIHRVVTEESRPETSQVLKERMVNPHYRENWEKQYGPYPGYQSTPGPVAPIKYKVTPEVQADMPYGIDKAIYDVQKDYPQAVVDDLLIDETNSGGESFITPDQKTGFEPGKPSITKNRPDFSVERQWVNTPLTGEDTRDSEQKYVDRAVAERSGIPETPPSWTNWMDQRADEGFFPRWQSTTALEPWPEDAIEDIATEFDRPAKAAARADYVMPPGLTFHPYGQKAGDGSGGVSVRLNDVDAGRLDWYEDGEVEMIHVPKEHRRKGIGTALYEWAAQHNPDLYHSEKLSPAGEAWSEAMFGWDPDGIPAASKVPKAAMAFPPGFEVKRKQVGPGYGGVDLFEPGGRDIGDLHWYDDNDEVAMIEIDPDHRRRGLGTELFNHVQQNIRPHLQHSDELSPDGAAFAKSMGWDPSPGGEDSIYALQFEAATPPGPGWIFPPHDEGVTVSDARQAPEGASWYHGSPNQMKPGERLRPFGGGGDRWGGGRIYDTAPQYGHRDQHVWAEHNPELSSNWAHPEARPYIYEIEPDEVPQAWNGTAQEGWVTPGATIKRLVSDNGWMPEDEIYDHIRRQRAANPNPDQAKIDALINGFAGKAASVFADPDGTGIWKTTSTGIEFIPAPHRRAS